MVKNKYECGIYQIRNIINNKIYIGSTKNFPNRWRNHKSDLNRNKHGNKYLQNAWNKYGNESFVFEKLLICDEKDLIMFEQKFIDYFKPCNRDNGYNLRELAESGPTKIWTDEERRKMSETKKGTKLSEETKRRISIFCCLH